MGEGDEDKKLQDATVNSLKVAEENRLKSIAFPAISTGIFGFPIQRCAGIMLGAVIEHLKGESGLERVVFCLFGYSDYQVFVGRLEEEMGA
jgi:O-acetyl-ADP-ribose deacetylase (regulator of RNase III)